MLDIFKDQVEVVFMVKLSNIWYLCIALNVLFTGHPGKKVTCIVPEKYTKI